MLRDIITKQKAITLEVLLPNNLKLHNLADKLKPFKGYINAINLPSNPLGRLRPDALCCAHILQDKTGIETIPHFVARHFTSLSFESHLLGAAALDIKNVLCVTGDTPHEGKSGFELNSSKRAKRALLLACRPFREVRTHSNSDFKFFSCAACCFPSWARRCCFCANQEE